MLLLTFDFPSSYVDMELINIISILAANHQLVLITVSLSTLIMIILMTKLLHIRR